jgi:uncharacterized protein YecE (DUF72 family)
LLLGAPLNTFSAIIYSEDMPIEGRSVKEYLIGTGGWAYFQVPGVNSLVAYSRVFNFVEVNSTFYEIPSLRKVEAWRKLVPSDFQFSVRAHRSITHTHKLRPVKDALETFEQMRRICSVLNADILHVQTPAFFKSSDTLAETLDDFLASVNLEGIRVALEFRATQPSKIPARLLKTMQDRGVIHCVDLSKGETPAFESDILYTRLFGKGRHNIYQPTDSELVQIDKEATSGGSKKVAMSFHFVRMYKDAARLKMYKQHGKFPMITKSTGLGSLEEILSEDAMFPLTKQELINSQGWKLFDVKEHQRTRAEQLLQNLPEGTYKNISEVIDRLESTAR